MKYILKIIGSDFKSFQIEILEEEVDKLITSMQENSVFFSADKSRGIYIPLKSIRYIYFAKKEEPCQKSPSSVAASDSNNSKENLPEKELAIPLP
ncbi:hypothetical protein UFOVP844_18 [uncultured Caudovirales phage]|uniref:Uncharacterized protein n=1 Tax=uncultured Caudovirales phage TaxID=2100421 RepID=A0A6J5PAK7_9CAUD|nr:hypothetical protein UFOVP844_18 [uncultured Caudovirales phage]